MEPSIVGTPSFHLMLCDPALDFDIGISGETLDSEPTITRSSAFSSPLIPV